MNRSKRSGDFWRKSRSGERCAVTSSYKVNTGSGRRVSIQDEADALRQLAENIKDDGVVRLNKVA